MILHSITFIDTNGGEEIEQKIRDEAVEKKAGETALLRKARAQTEADTRIIQAEAEAKEKEILAAAISENPEILEKQTSRIQRISKGSGTTTTEIRELLKQYKMIKEMMGMQTGLSEGKIDQKMMQKMAKKFRGKVKI